MHKGSLFSTSSPNLVIYCLLDDGHSNRCDVVSLIFISISLVVSDFEHLFNNLLAICISSSEKCLYSSHKNIKLKIDKLDEGNIQGMLGTK